MRIFVSGPYGNGKRFLELMENINRADEAARQLVIAGHIPFCPHSMSRGWERDPRLNSEHWFRIDFDMVENWADAVLRIPGESDGADREVALAQSLGKPIYYSLEEIPIFVPAGSTVKVGDNIYYNRTKQDRTIFPNELTITRMYDVEVKGDS